MGPIGRPSVRMKQLDFPIGAAKGHQMQGRNEILLQGRVIQALLWPQAAIGQK